MLHFSDKIVIYGMAFESTYPIINMNDFKECKWKYLYGDLDKAINPNVPEERGK